MARIEMEAGMSPTKFAKTNMVLAALGSLGTLGLLIFAVYAIPIEVLLEEVFWRTIGIVLIPTLIWLPYSIILWEAVSTSEEDLERLRGWHKRTKEVLAVVSTQERADQHLLELAIIFDSAAETEGVHAAMRARGDEGAMREGVAREQVQIAKDNFWSTHEIIKEAGFAVKESFRDYLPEDLRKKSQSRHKKSSPKQAKATAASS